MKRTNLKIISWIVSFVVIALFIWYFFSHLDDFSLLLSLNLWFVALVLVANFLSLVANGVFMKLSIALFDKHISIGESVRVSLISSAGNFFAPAGSGLGFRAVYLKKRHQLAYTDYLSILFCNYVIVFLVSSTLGLIALFLLRSQVSSVYFVILSFFALLFVASFAAFFLRIRIKEERLHKGNRLVRFVFGVVKRISYGWSLILSRRRVAVGLFVIILINALLSVLSAYFMVSSLGLSVTIPALILFSMLGSLSVFINITPGNLGVKEAVYIATSIIIGLTTAEVLSISLVDRTVMFVLLLALWLIYGRSITTYNKNKDPKYPV